MNAPLPGVTSPVRAFHRLSAAEAIRALSIDFEGEQDAPSVPLG